MGKAPHRPNIYPATKPRRIIQLLQYFWGLNPIIIWVAIFLQVIREAWVNLELMFLLQVVNALLAWCVDYMTCSNLEEIERTQETKASVKRNGQWTEIDSRFLVLGDRIKVGRGSVVPADATIGIGSIEVDQTHIEEDTGPVRKSIGEEIYLGNVVVIGQAEAIVLATGRGIRYGRPPSQLLDSKRKTHLQFVLFKVATFLSFGSLLLVLVILFVVVANGDLFLEAFSFCVTLLVASLPIQLQAVCKYTLSVGAHRMIERGAVVTHLGAIEGLACMDVLCVKKSEVLTEDDISLQQPLLLGNATVEDIFLAAALASQVDSQDQIDITITQQAAIGYQLPLKKYTRGRFLEFDPSFKRTEVTVTDNDTKEVFKCSKGAPQVILALAEDRLAIEEQVSVLVSEQASQGFGSLGVARTDVTGKWHMLGLIPYLDPVRERAFESIQKASQLRVKIKMVTGDQIAISQDVAHRLQLGDKIYNSEYLSEGANPIVSKNVGDLILAADGFAEVFPEHKFFIVHTLQEKKKVVGITGKHLTDTTALKESDIGIAVLGASDAIKSASDLILLQPGLSVIIEAIFQSRKAFQLIKNYLIYRLACTFQLLLFFFTTMIILNPQDFACEGHDDCAQVPSIFSLPVASLVLIIILNDGAILSVSNDFVVASKLPENWTFKVYYTVAAVIGLVAFVSSWILLSLSLDNMNVNDNETLLNWFQVPSFSYGEVMTVVWLKVSVSDYLTLWIARMQSYFWERGGGRLVVGSFFLAVATSSLCAAYWQLSFENDPSKPDMLPLSWKVIGFVWIYSVFFFLLQEVAKLVTYRGFMYYYSFKKPDQQAFTGQYVSDSFIVFSAARDGRHRSIITRRSLLAAKESVRER